MSALSQAGSASESLKRVAFAAILYFAVGITVPIYAQQAPYAQESPTPGQAQREMQQRLERRRQQLVPREMEDPTDPPATLRPQSYLPPNHAEQQMSGYEYALDAIQKQKELIAALERRVEELERELADCKAQTQEVVPPKQ